MGVQLTKHMNMIFYSSNFVECALLISHNAPNILIELALIFLMKCRDSVFCSEHDMVNYLCI
jgi:hypothetical protein